MASDNRHYRVLPIPYFAADAIVAYTLDTIGQDIGVVRRWTQTSGGSSYHRLADASGEYVGAHVQALNANDTAVLLHHGHSLQGHEQVREGFVGAVLSHIEWRVRSYQHIDPQLRMDISLDSAPPDSIVMDDLFASARGPNADTRMKLEKLRELREKMRSKRPRWIKACEQVGIEPRTAARHAAELREHWDDDD